MKDDFDRENWSKVKSWVKINMASVMMHKTISGNNGTVHYWTQGKGEECLVFTHGAVMDHGMFRDQVEYFSSNFQVICWDVPGHGLSRPYSYFSLENAARELLNILVVEHVQKAHLVGQSMGGYICQIAAQMAAEKIQSLAAVDSSPLQLAYYSRLDRWMLALTPILLSFYPYPVLIKLVSSQIASDEQSRNYALKTLRSFSKKEIIRIMDGVYSGLVSNQQEIKLNCPVLIMFGANDRTGKVQAYCRRWATKENRKMVILANAAHNANMDNPDAFNRALSEFLSSI
jgi:pimeloyl-ACP methyl ester carboxylesterase